MAQTGTVGAMLQNILRYNAGERGAVEEELRLAVPTLMKIGLFGLFPPEAWIAGDNPGRTFLGLQAARMVGQNGQFGTGETKIWCCPSAKSGFFFSGLNESTEEALVFRVTPARRRVSAM